jgi:hypothetical protein
MKIPKGNQKRKSENDRQWSKENKDKRILHSKPQNHKHVYLINQNSNR